MSERTTIGGTVYETVGSSSSNLLLKCNGTARIQWGNKLIDLIKNGKIASGDSSIPIFIISNDSEITNDGIYILTKNESSQLLIRKDNEVYYFTDTDLYISASIKQDTTAEQKYQALENIGIYYNSLEDVSNSGVQNGIAYVLENCTLYTIKDGNISEFEAKVKNVEVEKENKEGDIINNSVKIVLSILDTEYLVLENKRILAKKDVYVSNSAKVCSETATSDNGYRLYMDQGKSYLEVDYLKVRFPEETSEYITVTKFDLDLLITQNKLKPQSWYLISDYFNPWRFPNQNLYKHPILVRAATNNSLYPDGTLLSDRFVSIKYDCNFKTTLVSNGTEAVTPGLITWMKDANGNEANFDFLDYLDFNNNPMATLHFTLTKVGSSYQEGVKSIFPLGSYNNKLTVHNLKGIVINNSEVDYENSNVVDFNFPDSISANEVTSEEEIEALPKMIMHDNVIDCYGISTSETCNNFYNNTIKNSGNIIFEGNCFENVLSNIYTTEDGTETEFLEEVVLKPVIFPKSIIYTTLNECVNSIILGSVNRSNFDTIHDSNINNDIFNSTFLDISNCTFYASFNKVQFQNLTDCVINEGILSDINCRSDVYSVTVSSTSHPILYDSSKVKDVYFSNGEFQVIESAASGFLRGMIIMHTGEYPIPEGWAICDGQEHTYNGVTIKTPNLVNRFIKAVDNSANVGAVDNPDLNANNEFTITEAHLPEHNHPHKEHTHTISDSSVVVEESGDLSLIFTQNVNITSVGSTKTSVVSNITSEDVTSDTAEVVNDVSESSQENSSEYTITGGNHTHNATITLGEIASVTSEEDTKTWENKAFKIEPNYYSLIFIMKL